MNNSKRRSAAKSAAKAASKSERIERGWVPPAKRPVKAQPNAMRFVKDMLKVAAAAKKGYGS